MKKTLLLSVFMIFSLLSATANAAIKYGKHCTSQGGTEDCGHWTFSLYRCGIPFEKCTSGTNGVNDCTHDPDKWAIYQNDCCSDDVSLLRIESPSGEVKVFKYMVHGGYNGKTFISHDKLPFTGNIDLNEPGDTDITIQGSHWGI